MAKIVLDDVDVVLDSNDMSDHVSSVEITADRDEVDSTAFQGNGWRAFLAGLMAGNITLNFHQDFAAGNVDAILWPIFTAGAAVALVIAPADGGASATNPEYTTTVLLLNYSPLNGSVGALNETSVTLRITGAMTRETS